MKNTKRKAFTLVELLVVIAIIGILFVVLISKVDFATEKSKASGVQTDFRSYQLAIETVARENAGLSTLVDDDASGEEKYAALEAALNKNLDPKLRVEIDENGKISTDAKDPWKEEYTGQYLAPDADGTVKDRGAIVMYCKGSNLKLGSTAEIVNGVVNVTIESGKETEGADDYSISTIYTYVNGYGEIKTTTKGFSNNIGDENTNQGNNTPTNPADPDTPTEPEQGGEQEPVRLAAGLYDAEDNLVASWDELVNTYGMDVEKDYSAWTYKTDAASPYYVLTNYDDLTNGTKLVISESVSNIGTYSFYTLTTLANIDFGSNITKIDSNAFYACSGLTGELVIPNNVEEIGATAFMNCSNITNITIGSGVYKIGTGAFYGCSGLVGAYIADLEAWCKIDFVNYDSGPFPYVQELYINNVLTTDLVIPDGITEIKQHAFYGLQCIKTLTISDGVTSVGKNAFRNCSGLISVFIPDSVKTISSDAFASCSGLTGVYITDIAAWCKIDFYSNPLRYAKNIYLNNEPINNLVIPNEITEIKNETFGYAQNITGTLTIHNNVTSIGDAAFINCSGLTGTLVIPNSIENIGRQAFKGCSGLTNVDFRSDAISIGQNAFGYCEGLTGVYISDLRTWCKMDFANEESNPLYCAENLYLNNVPITNLVIPDQITEIKNYTFINAKNIVGTLTIHDEIINIGDCAFKACSGLTGLDLGSNVTSIGKDAFYHCDGMSGKLTLPETLTTIGDRAFGNCIGFTGELIIPDSVTTIGDHAFYCCTGITSIIIPETVTNLDSYTFYACSKLETITIKSKTLVAYTTSLLSQYTALTAIYVPADLVDQYKAADGWIDFADKIQAIPTT